MLTVATILLFIGFNLLLYGEEVLRYDKHGKLATIQKKIAQNLSRQSFIFLYLKKKDRSFFCSVLFSSTLFRRQTHMQDFLFHHAIRAFRVTT